MANFNFYSFSTKSEIFIVLSHQGIIYDTSCNYLPAEFFLPIFTYFVLWSILIKKIWKILKNLYFEKFMPEGVKQVGWFGILKTKKIYIVRSIRLKLCKGFGLLNMKKLLPCLILNIIKSKATRLTPVFSIIFWKIPDENK